ncbi:MAG: cytosolic protein [Deltaproteobacteria bacterium]|nr:cytosolic protein [Deltaproteobacteria bacterium]
MNPLNADVVYKFVNQNIVMFHNSRLERLKKINLHEVLKKKNPYLFKAKNVTTASQLIQSILDAFISSSEEKMFGNFLEELAIFICSKVYGGRKSSSTGIDLEFENSTVRYIVAIKSGPNWGNSSQYAALRANFEKAKRVLSQSKQVKFIQPILGICYGKNKTRDYGLYKRIAGQNFWYFISGNKNLYTDIIKPIGYKAKQHNESYDKQKSRVYNLFTQELLNEFCQAGEINWKSLVKFNSGNYEE